MRRFAIAVFLSLFFAGAAFPCGDKLSSMNRGVRLQRAIASRRPAAIVILSGETLVPKQVETFRAGFARGGHRVEVASSRADLAAILSRVPHDVVVVASADVADVETELGKMSPPPALIRVVDRPTRSQWKAELARCPLAIRTDSDSIEQLAAIDGAMRMRRGGTNTCAR